MERCTLTFLCRSDSNDSILNDPDDTAAHALGAIEIVRDVTATRTDGNIAI